MAVLAALTDLDGRGLTRFDQRHDIGHGPYRPHRGPRCGCRRGSRCATNAQPPRAPKGHRKRRFQSGQPFGLRAPRATRSIPGAATVSAACCASSAATRYAWRRSTNRWARLGRRHATVACDIVGTYPRDAAATFACLDVSALVTGGRARAGSAPAEKGTPTHRPATAGRGPACPAGAVVPAATACRVGRRRRAAAPCSGPPTRHLPRFGRPCGEPGRPAAGRCAHGSPRRLRRRPS